MAAYPSPYGPAQGPAGDEKEEMSRFYQALALASNKYFWGMVVGLIGALVVAAVAIILVGSLGLPAIISGSPEAALAAILGAALIILVVAVVFLSIEAYFLYKGSQALRDSLAWTRHSPILFQMKTPSDLLYYGGLLMLIGAITTIILIGLLLYFVGFLLFMIGLILLASNLKNLDPKYMNVANLIIIGAALSLVSLISVLFELSYILSLAGTVILLYSFHQLQNLARQDAATHPAATATTISPPRP